MKSKMSDLTALEIGIDQKSKTGFPFVCRCPRVRCFESEALWYGWSPPLRVRLRLAGMEQGFEGGGEIGFIPRIIAGALSGALTGFFAIGNNYFPSFNFVFSFVHLGRRNLAICVWVLEDAFGLVPEASTVGEMADTLHG